MIEDLKSNIKITEPINETETIVDTSSVTSSDLEVEDNIIISEDIRFLQEALYKLKFTDVKLIADGIVNDETLEAIKKCQSLFGLVPDGVVGPITVSSVKHILAKPFLMIGNIDNLGTKYIQFRCGETTNGKWDIKTTEALKNLQRHFGIDASGTVDLNTWKFLI